VNKTFPLTLLFQRPISITALSHTRELRMNGPGRGLIHSVR
jgi:hypothetical protein